MTRRALGATGSDRRAVGAAADRLRWPGLAMPPRDPRAVHGGADQARAAPTWPEVVAALSGTDEDELPLFGRFPG